MSEIQQEQAPYMGSGRVRKVMSLKTSDEVRQARMIEKREKMLAKRRALLDAVEQAVALPEPMAEMIATKPEAPEPMVDTKEHDEQPVVSTKRKVWKVMEEMRTSIGLFMDKMQGFVLEEG